MNVRPAVEPRAPEAVPAWTEGVTAAAADHAGVLDGATVTGEAARRHLSVRIGIWIDERGAVRRARWRAAKDPVLRAYAEAACTLLEAGTEPALLDGVTLRNSVQAAVPAHADVADLVAGAVNATALLAAGGARR